MSNLCSNSSSREGIPNIHNNYNNSKNKKVPKRKRITASYQFDNNGGSSAAISVNAIQKLNKQAQSQHQAQTNTNAVNNIGKSLKMGASSRWLLTNAVAGPPRLPKPLANVYFDGRTYFLSHFLHFNILTK